MLEALEQSILSLQVKPSSPAMALLNKNYRAFALREAGSIGTEKAMMAFVDGGNSAVVKTPSAELQRIRTATVTITDNKLSSVRQREGYVLVMAAIENENLIYHAQILDSTLDITVNFSFTEAELGENATTKAAEIIRRLAEIKAAAAALKIAAWVVLDGTLEAQSEKEQLWINKLSKSAKEAGTGLGSVAKTCTLLTTDGEPLIAAAEQVITGEGYAVIAERVAEKHTIAVARLNNAASHLFRIEATDRLPTLLAALKEQSNDITFPGYPYGLIMADRFARISNSETELMRTRLQATAGPKLRKLLGETRALDAHKILDSM